MAKIYLFPLLIAMLAGCSGMRGEDDDLCTIPITNNPHIVPNYGAPGGIPMPSKAH